MPAAAGQRAWLSKNGLKFRIQVARVEGTTTATPGSCSGALRLEQPVRGRRVARHAPRVSAARSTRAGRRPGAGGFRTGGEGWPGRGPRRRRGWRTGRGEGRARSPRVALRPSFPQGWKILGGPVGPHRRGAWRDASRGHPAARRPAPRMSGRPRSLEGAGDLARGASAGFLGGMPPEVRFLYVTVPERQVGLDL